MRRRVLIGLGFAIGLGSMTSMTAVVAVVAGQAASLPPAQSITAAKEVVGLMTQSKKDCVVMEHSSVFGGYIAALLVPGAKLTVVTARFKDTTSMVYKIYQKDCMGAYADLSAAVDAMDRVVVDDIAADGLIAAPKKDLPRDGITRDGQTTKFDSDKNRLKQLKMTPDEFTKSFVSADETYTQLLLLLSKELKK